MGEFNTQDLHDFREEIDANIKKCESFKNLGGSAGRELSLTYTKLQEAKMWIDEALKAVDSEPSRDEAEQPAGDEAQDQSAE